MFNLCKFTLLVVFLGESMEKIKKVDQLADNERKKLIKFQKHKEKHTHTQLV